MNTRRAKKTHGYGFAWFRWQCVLRARQQRAAAELFETTAGLHRGRIKEDWQLCEERESAAGS